MVKTLKSKLAQYENDAEFQAELAKLEPEIKIMELMVQARKKAGLSQRELAKRMGKPQSTIARIESGAQIPTIKTLLSVAKATGTELDMRLI